MADLITSGRIIDLILVVIGLELTALAVLARLRPPGLRFGRLLSLVIPGVCIFLALKAALVSAGWGVIALFLAMSGIAHAFDVWIRWTETKTEQQTSPTRKEVT